MWQSYEASQNTNYGEVLSEMLRDRLVWGVRDTVILKKLLGKADLTLEKAIQLAQSLERAEQNVREMDNRWWAKELKELNLARDATKKGKERSCQHTRDTTAVVVLFVSTFATSVRIKDT